MFTYFYRLLDRYHKQVTALAIFTDEKQGYKPDHYFYEFLGTSQTYRFNTYKVLEQDEEALTAHPNPFALVVLTVLLALKNKKAGDERLMELKIDLFRRMLTRKIEKPAMRALASFLKMYVNFSKPETNRIFETEIKVITHNTTTMGIEELILHRAEQKGKLAGKAEGLAEGLAEGKVKGKVEGKLEEVRNLIVKLGLNNEQAADIAEVTPAFVQQVREGLSQ